MVTVSEVRCNRCGYKWLPRQVATPLRCPKCHSPYWNKPRVRKASPSRMERRAQALAEEAEAIRRELRAGKTDPRYIRPKNGE